MKAYPEKDLFQQICASLYTPVVGDILDALGFYHQFLPQAVHPLTTETRMVGRAMPVQIADAWGKQQEPFGKLTEALDQIEAGEIYLATGGSLNCAAWGEILTATAKARGGVGAVIDGFHRDTPRVLEQNWPVFSRGRYAQDAGVRAKIVNYRCTVKIGGVTIEPGSLIFGDLDGVVVIPKSVEKEVLDKALEKAHAEKVVRKDIEAGATSTAVFKKYGVL